MISENITKAFEHVAADLLAIARRQEAEIAELRQRLQQETDRADHWHARAAALNVLQIPSISPGGS